MTQKSPVVDVLSLCVQRQAAAVSVFLSLFRLSILAFEIGEGHVERFMTEPDSQGFTVEHLKLTSGWTIRELMAIRGLLVLS
jgi:hypothetical protein